MRLPLLLALFSLPLVSPAQWKLQDSHSTASLRGIDSLGNGVVWASGSGGTVLHTEDGGRNWQSCSKPPGADTLDFRGVQAWDANRAVVMSSGKGSLSRLYATADGCRSWTLLYTNPDPEGFWDAIQFVDAEHGVLLGDPVGGDFVLLFTRDGGRSWIRKRGRVAEDATGASVFAASNSALHVDSPSALAFCTGGPAGPSVVMVGAGPYAGPLQPGERPWANTTSSEQIESFTKTASSGCFSLATSRDGRGVTVAVGGDYLHPDAAEDNAWTTAVPTKGNKLTSLFTFSPAKQKPHGYRSAVAYDPVAKVWVTVGPNGTDVSADDGQTWHAVKPSRDEATGEEVFWNALSLPFAVGPHGRIGRLRDEALPDTKRAAATAERTR